MFEPKYFIILHKIDFKNKKQHITVPSVYDQAFYSKKAAVGIGLRILKYSDILCFQVIEQGGLNGGVIGNRYSIGNVLGRNEIMLSAKDYIYIDMLEKSLAQFFLQFKFDGGNATRPIDELDIIYNKQLQQIWPRIASR